MKTRVVKVSRGYVPQVQKKKVCLFFNKLVWAGITHDNLLIEEGRDQLKFCLVKTEKEAEEIILRHNSRKDDITLLS